MTKYLSNKRYFLGLALTVLFLCAISFFFESRAYFGSTDGKFFTNFEFLFSAMALGIFEICILIVAKKSFKIKMRWGIACVLAFFFVTSTIGILLYDGVNSNGAIIAELSKTSKIRYIIFAFLLYSSMYEIIAIIPHFVKGHRMIRIVFFAAAVSGIAAIGYSYLTEFAKYEQLFKQSDYIDFASLPISYTTHRNVYAFVIFCAMVGEAYLDIERPHWWRWILMIFFYANQFLIISKTCILISTFFLFAYLVYSFARSIKNHKPGRIVFLLVLIAFIVGAFLTLEHANIDNDLFKDVQNYWKYIENNIKAMIKNSYDGRITLYKIPFDAVKGRLSTFLFGFGYGNEYAALGAYYCGDPSVYLIIDNSWSLAIAQGGIFGIYYSLLVWAFAFVLIVKAFVRKSKYAFVSLIMYACLLCRTITENDNISYLDFPGVCYFSLTCLPLLVEEAKLNVAQLTVKTPDYMHDRELRPSLYLARAFALSFLPSFFLVALAKKIGYMLDITYLQTNLLRYGGLIMLFVSPFVLGGILLAFKKGEKGAGIFSLIIYFAYIASIFVCPLFTQSKLILLVEIGILLIDFFVLSMAAVYKMKFFSFLTAIMNYLIFAAVCGATYWLFQRYNYAITLYSLIAIFSTCIALCIYLFLMPRKPSMFAPFEDSIERLEISYSIKRLAKEKRFEARTEKIFRVRKRN